MYRGEVFGVGMIHTIISTPNTSPLHIDITATYY